MGVFDKFKKKLELLKTHNLGAGCVFEGFIFMGRKK